MPDDAAPEIIELEGGCLCGTCRYRLHGRVRFFQYCHCSRCRKLTGSAHAANLFVRPEDLHWLEGSDQIGTYRLKGEPEFPTAFCKNCGSTLPAMSSTGRFWVVPAGTLEGDPGARPARNIFWDSRAPWFEATSTLPHHSEMP